MTTDLLNINSVGVIKTHQGFHMVTSGGRKVSILSPQPDQINLKDAAHALSLQCRYAGNCSRFYSVAEHTCWGAFLLQEEDAPKEIIQSWLLHDVSEAYIGDIIRPVKVYLPAFQDIEERFMEVIYKKFNTPRNEKQVYRVDNIMSAIEKASLFPNNSDVWPGLPDVSNYNIDLKKNKLYFSAKETLIEWFEDCFDV